MPGVLHVNSAARSLTAGPDYYILHSDAHLVPEHDR
jgi:hypothetical protein